jgi:acyl-CoA reductase-like NAD-dependent aldehyde dehydrogenase
MGFIGAFQSQSRQNCRSKTRQGNVLGTKSDRDAVGRGGARCANGRGEGATLATDGGRPAHLEPARFVEPTVFGNVENSSTIVQDEIFGPS